MKSTEFLTVSVLESAPDDGNRYEVIEGQLHVSEAPSFFHQLVLGNLTFVWDCISEIIRPEWRSPA